MTLAGNLPVETGKIAGEYNLSLRPVEPAS